MNSISKIITAITLNFILFFGLIQHEKDKKRRQAEEDKRQRLIFEKNEQSISYALTYQILRLQTMRLTNLQHIRLAISR